MGGQIGEYYAHGYPSRNRIIFKVDFSAVPERIFFFNYNTHDVVYYYYIVSGAVYRLNAHNKNKMQIKTFSIEPSENNAGRRKTCIHVIQSGVRARFAVLPRARWPRENTRRPTLYNITCAHCVLVGFFRHGRVERNPNRNPSSACLWLSWWRFFFLLHQCARKFVHFAYTVETSV